MESQISLSFDLGTNGVPHFCPQDDVRCRSFIALQLPEQISSITALEGMTELETLIRETVSPTSIIKPLGCDANLLGKKDTPNIVFHKSHLVFCFSRVEANHTQLQYEQFFRSFSEFLSTQSLPHELMMEFNVRYTHFRTQGFNGFSADLKVSGNGKSSDEARQVADVGYAKFRVFITQDDIKYHLG